MTDKNEMIFAAWEELANYENATDFERRVEKSLHAIALSLLAIHFSEPQLAAEKVGQAASLWFAAPSQETFANLQHAVGAWRAVNGLEMGAAEPSNAED